MENQTAHAVTGRISRLKMRTMSLFESNESNGQISLGALFDYKQDASRRNDGIWIIPIGCLKN